MALSKSTKTKSKSKSKGKSQHKAVLDLTAAINNDDRNRSVAEQHQDHSTGKGSGNDDNHMNSSPGKLHHPNTGTMERNDSRSGKKLSTSAVNIKRREDYANMDAASKDRERTRVKRSRAVKMARDSLPGTAWAELGRKAQVEVAGAIAEEIRCK